MTAITIPPLPPSLPRCRAKTENGKQVQEKLSDIARFRKGEPDAAEIAAAKEAQEKRNKKACFVRGVCM